MATFPSNSPIRNPPWPYHSRPVERSSRRLGAGASSAARAEEVAQQGSALLGQHTAGDLRAPMARGLVEEAGAVDDRAAFGIVSPEYQAAYASMADSAGAHGAGLEGHDQRQARQAIVAELGRGGAQGQDFGVGGRVMAGDRGVGGARHDLAGRRIDDHRADGRLAPGGGGLRLFQGDAHGGLIMKGHSPHRTDQARAGQDAPSGDRVAKVLARAGVASRREVERLIEAGRVALNGQVLTSPAVKVGEGDILTFDGEVVNEAEPTRLFRYHKPSGLMTTHNDPKGRKTVFDTLPEGLPRLISVGRLDINSEGLLLLTNDGALARARGRVEQAKLDRLKDGVTVEGVRYGPIEATLDKVKAATLKKAEGGANVWITLTLAEGKNREVRRVLEHLGLSVNRLMRLAYGPFALGTLAPGALEEVGPRVIREQLADHVAVANMPKGDRAQYKPPSARAERRREPGARAESGEATSVPPAKKTYKPGWAKAKAPSRHTQKLPAKPKRNSAGSKGTERRR